MTEKQERAVWGITKTDRKTVHLFRHGRRLCPGKNGGHGFLFLPRPNWDPELPGTCEICKDILALERKESQSHQKAKV